MPRTLNCTYQTLKLSSSRAWPFRALFHVNYLNGNPQSIGCDFYFLICLSSFIFPMILCWKREERPRHPSSSTFSCLQKLSLKSLADNFFTKTDFKTKLWAIRVGTDGICQSKWGGTNVRDTSYVSYVFELLGKIRHCWCNFCKKLSPWWWKTKNAQNKHRRAQSEWVSALYGQQITCGQRILSAARMSSSVEGRGRRTLLQMGRYFGMGRDRTYEKDETETLTLSKKEKTVRI